MTDWRTDESFPLNRAWAGAWRRARVSTVPCTRRRAGSGTTFLMNFFIFSTCPHEGGLGAAPGHPLVKRLHIPGGVLPTIFFQYQFPPPVTHGPPGFVG